MVKREMGRVRGREGEREMQGGGDLITAHVTAHVCTNVRTSY